MPISHTGAACPLTHSLEMQAPLGPIENVASPNSPTPILVVAITAYKEGMGEILTLAWYTDGASGGNLATWILVAIQPNTDTI